MIPVREVGRMLLEEPPAPGRRAHVAAASGLVACGDRLAVVADDEPHLALFDDVSRPGRLHRLFAGELPDAPAARKARKPDLEALVLLGPAVLVALGSGSTEKRRRGALVTLDDGRPGAVRTVDLSPLYAALGGELPELNIEGAAVSGRVLRLLQRGNGASGVHAVVDIALAALHEALERDRAWPAEAIERITRCELGEVRGTRLGFTDASPLPDGRIVFCAAAETGDDTYADGAFTGAALGVLDARGGVQSVEPLAAPAKVEGVHATPRGGRVDVLLVTDADDPGTAAHLFEGAFMPR